MDATACYRAYAARDPRFDGVFYLGVTSTGIYCRPICPARTAKAANCRFYPSAEAAEGGGFRPCLRCRPELAPGAAPVDDAQRVAQLLVQRLAEGATDDGVSLESVAAQFELSARQLRRIVRQEIGVSPIALVQTRRLLLAKQLLTETRLPITEVAFASGFASLRRFNAAFAARYRMPPTRLRKDAAAAGDADPAAELAGTSTLRLTYRAPYDWAGILAFLRARMLKGAEWVTEDAYLRTVRLGAHRGWVAVRHLPAHQALQVEFTRSLTPALPALLRRLRNLFDLDARPDLIAAQLQQDKRLRAAVRATPGLRVPGAFDGFEMAMRAILGQQVTVAAATTLAGRLAQRLGEPVDTPWPQLTHLAPTAERVAQASVDAIASQGVVGARARCILALAQACAAGTLRLEAGLHPDRVMQQLVALPGIGPWTAHYLAMRALRWPDAFPKEDIAVRDRLGRVTAAEAEALSQAWRPWRSYAVLHLWRMPAASPRKPAKMPS